MITTKIGQIENTIKLQKDSLKRNTFQNAEFISKNIQGDKKELSADWQTHLKTCYAIALNNSNDLASMFYDTLDMNERREVKKHSDQAFKSIRNFKKAHKFNDDAEEVYLDYAFKMYEVINKFAVALYEGKDEQFMESIKFFKKLNSNGKLI